MIIGDGLIATAFMQDYKDDDRFLIFASGVSNSAETNPAEFLKEKLLLQETLSLNPSKHILYFASFIDSSPSKIKYLEHKKEMEEIVRTSKNYYTILRLAQVIGNGGNKNTLINFIVSKLKNNEEIPVYKNTYKSLIDVEDVKGIADILLKVWKDKNTYVEFPYIEKLLVEKIINIIANILHIEPKMKFIEAPMNDLPELSIAGNIILHHLNINPKGYTELVIKKYIK